MHIAQEVPKFHGRPQTFSVSSSTFGLLIEGFYQGASGDCPYLDDWLVWGKTPHQVSAAICYIL